MGPDASARAARTALGDRGRRSLPRQQETPDLDDQAEFLVSLDMALDRLGDLNPCLRTVTECRFFAGMTENETAKALGVDSRTARRYWAKAKAWLATDLGLVD